jgi:hypothetical protein
MKTVFGIALDAIGAASSGGRYWSTRSVHLGAVQDPVVAVDVDHSGIPIGRVVFIERTADGQVRLVAEVDDEVSPEVRVRVGTELRSVPTPYFWSISRIGGAEDGYLLESVALSPTPARIAARPVTFRHGAASTAADKATDDFERALLRRASEYDLRRHHGAPLVVYDEHRERAIERTWDEERWETRTPHPSTGQRVPPQYRAGWEPGMIEWSQHGGRILGVS